MILLLKTMEIQKKVFRFKFSDDLVKQMSDFSNIHKFDKKEIFDEHWERFIKNNEDIIKTEETRLFELGYRGSINDKIYKSIKYYYIKKNTVACSNDTKKDRPKKKKNISLGLDVIEDMHNHIEANIIKSDYKPESGFNNFIENYNIKDNEEFLRYKKAYKNMYYRINL